MSAHIPSHITITSPQPYGHVPPHVGHDTAHSTHITVTSQAASAGPGTLPRSTPSPKRYAAAFAPDSPAPDMGQRQKWRRIQRKWRRRRCEKRHEKAHGWKDSRRA
eukprot:2963486-Rhodomonas_salina.1